MAANEFPNTPEISVKDWESRSQESFLLIDMRMPETTAYGTIPGAVLIPETELSSRIEEIDKTKPVILVCARGEKSVDAALMLRENGIQAWSLAGGYRAWLMAQIEKERGQDEERRKEIETGIRKTWHKRLFSKFAQAVKTYELVEEGDKIAVCISGGKDSMLMAKLFQELQRHRKVHFDLVFLVMDPGYSPENRQVIEHNARLLGIPVTIFETEIFDIVYETEKSPCYLCARMRRGHLYSRAKALGCNKIALGHHYDDVIETILMGMLYGGQVQTMMPKLHSTNFEGMELIRPMYLIREADIKAWRDANQLHFIQCACHFTDTCTTCDPDGRTVSKRMEVKNLIAELKKTNPFVEGNIFKSVENVNLNTVIEYKEGNTRHSFLERYHEKADT